MAKIRLSEEERQIVQKLTTPQLQFFTELKNGQNFDTLKSVVNSLIDVEKNIFFVDNQAWDNPQLLHAKHCYAKGGIAKMTQLLHIVVGAETELEQRENERKKRQEDK